MSELKTTIKLLALLMGISMILFWVSIGSGASPYVFTIGQGGTGTSTSPSDGQLLIGSGGNYKVGNLTAGSNITITNGSGTISISSTGGSGGGVSTSSPFTVGYLPFATSSSAITNSNIFQSGSNIGIGTTTPAFKFVVNGTSSFVNGYVAIGEGVTIPAAPLDVRGTGIIGASIDVVNAGIGITNIGGLTLSASNPTTNNYVGILFSDNISAVSGASGHIGMQMTDRTNHYGDISFATRSAGGYTEKMRIMSDGKIGIGTANPSSKLDIQGGNLVVGGSQGTTTISGDSSSTFAGDVNVEGQSFRFSTGDDGQGTNAGIYEIQASDVTQGVAISSPYSTSTFSLYGLSGNQGLATFDTSLIGSSAQRTFSFPNKSMIFAGLDDVNLKVSSSTQVIAGIGLSGGGALTGNVTLNNAGVLSLGAATGTITLRTPLTITSGVLNMPTSTNSVSGYLSSADWTTFNNKQNNVSWPIAVASTSLAVTSPLSLSTNQLSMPTSTASQDGFLLKTDWVNFNAKITTSSISETVPGIDFNNVTGVFSLTANYDGLVTTASGTAWNTAYSERRQWDGGSTNLVAVTGRTSLGLGTMALLANTGSSSITTVGTLTAGALGAGFTAIGDNYISSAATWNAKITTSSISETITGINYNNTTGVFSIASGYEIPTTASSSGWNLRDISIDLLNATTTRNGSIQKLFFRPATIREIQCSTASTSITVGLDERASTTPNGGGTDIFTGGSMVCDNNGNATTTFANASISAGNTISLDIDSVADATTTLRIHIKFSEP